MRRHSILGFYFFTLGTVHKRRMERTLPSGLVVRICDSTVAGHRFDSHQGTRISVQQKQNKSRMENTSVQEADGMVVVVGGGISSSSKRSIIKAKRENDLKDTLQSAIPEGYFHQYCAESHWRVGEKKNQ